MSVWASRYVVCVAQTQMSPLPSGFAWDAWVPDQDIADADQLAEMAGRLCYQSWANPAGRTNAEYLANIRTQEHFSVIEHAAVTFALGGVSRAFTHELIRHRHNSYSQLSQRFVNEATAQIVLPPLYAEIPAAQALLEEMNQILKDTYDRLVALGTGHLRETQPALSGTLRRKRAREAARAVLPNMMETQIVVTGNHRSWREILAKRGNAHADAEMRAVMLDIFPHLAAIAPAIYADLAIGPDPVDGLPSILLTPITSEKE